MAQMSHPDSSQTIDVSPSQVETYESQGWEKKTARKKTARKSTTSATKKPAADSGSGA